jgi:hypothetical protein
MGLWSGGDLIAMVGSCGGGGGSVTVLSVPLGGDDGGGGHTTDLVSDETRSTSLAPVHGAKVPVGRPRGLIQIHAIFLYTDLLGGGSGTGMTSIGSSPSSSSTTATSTTSSRSATHSSPSLSPSLGLSDDNIVCLHATG